MKKYILIIVFVIFCFVGVCAKKNYNVLLNPQNPDVEIISDEYILFILDYSNSMNEMLVDSTKYDMLLASMRIILSRMSPQNKTGLRVYGQRWGFTPIDACRASCLAVPVGVNNYGEISDALTKYKPRGMTPITYSLKQAVQNDLKGLDGEKHIILITDGGENCGGDPCAFAKSLMRKRSDIHIDVVLVSSYSKALSCLSTVTGGHFYTVYDLGDFTTAITNSIQTPANTQIQTPNQKYEYIGD